MFSRKLLIVLLGLLPACFLGAQAPDSMNLVRGELLVALNDHMSSIKVKEVDEVYKRFEQAYSSGMFDEEEVELILLTASDMLNRRMSARPIFEDYLSALINLKNGEHKDTVFYQWHGILSNIVSGLRSGQAKPFQDYVRFSRYFFEQGALHFSPSPSSSSWYAVAPDYALRYEEGVPLVSFPELDLMAASNRDSIFIYETTGSYYPLEDQWEGQGGRVTWERHGWSEDTYAELGAYSFGMNRSLYRAADVRMHMPIHVGTQVMVGELSDKLTAGNETAGGIYPQFTSYGEIVELENLGQGIRFRGGFGLQGPTMYGFGVEGEKASVQIVDEADRTIFKATSENFRILREVSLSSQTAEASFYFGRDSIFHPSVSIRFDIAKREMELSRGNRGGGGYPFFSSLHQVNIDTDNIYAYLDRDSVLIGSRKLSFQQNDATVIESVNYFNPRTYQGFQGIASYNPIAILKATAENENTRTVDANLLAYRINSRFTVENIQTLLNDLAAGGFIFYDPDEEEIEVTDKVFHYVNAAQGKVDFDYLRIQSSTDSTNALLDLNNSNIAMRGIRNMEFSKRQRVAVEPRNETMFLQENRNMTFAGRLYAGYTIIEGDGFTFDYDNFRISLDSIGYFQLFVPTGEVDPDGVPIAYATRSKLAVQQGLLQIDAPNNKSGREDIPLFPSFRSNVNAFIFYEEAMDSAYHRDSFYFETSPFNLDQLDAFVPPDISFKGRLVSADIFPDIPETLLLQSDYSLGFTHQIDEPGLPVYSGRGNFGGSITLDHDKGLRGNGTLQYLWSAFQSDDVIFLPRELRTTAQSFSVEEDRQNTVQVPQIRGQEISVNWFPLVDSMYVRPENERFALFQEDDHTLTGTLVLSPGGIAGIGELDWSKARVRSDHFTFGANSARADTAFVDIKATGAEEVAVQSEGMLAELDFDRQQASFTALSDSSNTVLPYNRFETSMNAFDWDIEGETLTFRSEPGQLGRFLSMRPDQDSLGFETNSAFYDLTSNQLRLEGVPEFIAADAYIYPDSGQVNIQPEGIVATLENARIVADTANQLHVINRATVDILGRKEYRASGYYAYPIGDRQQEILFQDITGTRVGKGSLSEKQVATRASGVVSDSAQFYIDHKTLFQGNISLASESANLQFDGFARLDAEKLPETPWFSVRSPGDKQNLTIAYDRPMTYEGQPVETGIFLSRETAQIYPRVMMPLSFRRDRPILPVQGYFTYDEQKDHFLFGDSTRIFENSPLGTGLVFDNSDGSVVAEGPVNIASGATYIDVDAAGTLKTSFPPTKTVVTDAEGSLDVPDYMPVEVEVMAGLSMRIPQNLLVVMNQDIIASSFDADDVDYRANETFFKRTARQLFPQNPEVEYAIQAISSGYLDIPSGYNPYDIVFSKLDMTWDAEYQSFVVKDPSKVGVLSIFGQPVHKMLECYVEFRMPTNEDDRVYIYLKSPSDLYYFFGYNKGILSITSNSPRFMDELLDLKKRDLVQKMDDGETFEIQVVEPSTARMFLRRMEALDQ